MKIAFVRLAVGAAIGTLAMGGGAAAVHAQGTIYACVKTGQGQLRIVQATDSCLIGEQRLQWPASAPAKGALRVLDANDTFVGWYDHGGWGDSATTTIPVGSEWLTVPLDATGPRKTGGPNFYFNTACPDPADPSVLHASATGAYLLAPSQPLVKFAFGLSQAPNVVYYAGPQDPTFVPLSWETDADTTRLCFPTYGAPYFSTLTYAPARTFDLSVFTPPFRVVQ